MSKGKKKTPPKPSYRKQIYRAASTTMDKIDFAVRQGEDPGSYLRRSISSSLKLDEIEKALSNVDKAILRCIFYQRINPLETDACRQLEQAAGKHEDPVKLTLRKSLCVEVSMLLAEIVKQQNDCAFNRPEDMCALISILSEGIPEEFTARLPEFYNTDAQLGDCCASTILHSIDWSCIFDGTMQNWAKNISIILDSFITEETRARYDAAKDSLVDKMAGFYAALIPSYREKGEKQAIEINPTLQTSADAQNIISISAVQKPSALPKAAPVAPLAVGSNLSFKSLPIAEQIKVLGGGYIPPELIASSKKPARNNGKGCAPLEKMMASKLHAICYYAVSNMYDVDMYRKATTFLVNNFSPAEIIYSFITFLQICENDELPLFLGHLIDAIQNVYELDINDSNAYRNRVKSGEDPVGMAIKRVADDRIKHIYSCTCSEIPKSYYDEKHYEPIGPINTFSIRGHIYRRTKAILSPTITLDLRDKELFMETGLSEEDALAMCGYESACDEFSFSWAVNPWRTADDIIEAENQQAKSLSEEYERGKQDAYKEAYDAACVKIRAEVAADMEKADQRRKRAETSEAQMRREQRTMVYRAEKAEKELADKSAECERLSLELKRVLAEQERLSRALAEMSSDAADNNSLVDDEPSDPQYKYPMPEIGKDLSICVVGGTPNWANEMLRRFPNITTFDADSLPNEDTVNHADLLMVFSFVIPHKFFWIIRNSSKRKDIPLVYFDRKGINACSEQLIEAYYALKEPPAAEC